MSESTPTTDFSLYLRGCGEHAALHGNPIPYQVILYVVRAGPLQSEGSLREIGICLSKTPMPGDRLIDTLRLERRGTKVRIHSLRQSQSKDYVFGPDGAPHFDRNRKGCDRVCLGGRSANWGQLGDDSYEPGDEDYLLQQIVAEAFFGAEWRVARVDYEVLPLDEAACDAALENKWYPGAPVATVDLAGWERAGEARPGWNYYRDLGRQGEIRDEKKAYEAEQE